MVKKIKCLTEAQIALMPVVRDEFLRRGLSTGPVDRAAAKNAVNRAYLVAGLQPPQITIWLRSPLEGAWAAALLAKGLKFREQVASKIKDKVWAEVNDQVGTKVSAQVWEQVWEKVINQVRPQVSDQVSDQVWAQVRDEVGAKVSNQVADKVARQVWAQVRDQLTDQVSDQFGAKVSDKVWAQVSRCGYGAHDASWLSFYAYFRHAANLACCERLRPLIDLSANCGWWWPFERAVILTQRPIALYRDDQNCLHNEDGPAIEYSDGFAVHAWHGTRVPAHWIQNRTTLDPA